MQCMEVWGGNRPVESGVVMAGLDAWVVSRPYAGAESGGDVHYVSSCATGRITRLLVADVAGHGTAVARTAAALRTLMRRFVNYVDQTRFVHRMNGEFATLSSDGTFATAVVATFYAPTGALSVCNAGHPAPLLYRAATRNWSLLQHAPRGGGPPGRNLPLGVVDRAAYDQFNLTLGTGDMVLCYTDSLIEARDAGGAQLGLAGLLRIVQSLDAGRPERLAAALLETVAALGPGNVADDDATVLLFRPNGLAPRAPLGQRVLAPLRVLAAILGSLRPGGQAAPWPELSLQNLLGISPKRGPGDEPGA